MTDLVAFLTARLDEDQKTAEGLAGMVNSLNEANDRLPAATRRGTQLYDTARWALNHVLMEIAAKRGRLTLYRESIKSLNNAYDKMQAATDEPTRRATLSRYDTAVGFHSAAAQAIYIDLLVYKGHEGFDPGWKELIKYPDSGW